MVTMFRADATFLSELDRILEGICRKLQLTPTQHDLARQHYEAVGNWLEHEGSILAPYHPKIYPQGSLAMGITNKPLGKEEYDLDFICELSIPWWTISPEDLVSKFEYRIREHQDYTARMERGNRCIRLTYAHNFHLDIVPACSNKGLGYGQIRIPDKKAKSWKDSNSKDYIKWFNKRARQSRRVDSAEPLPLQESLEEKPALKCAVQLFKRHRDVAFRNMLDLAPVSIVLGTLCAIHYQGQESVGEAVAGILNGIAQSIAQNQGSILLVLNPANKVREDLGERWKNAEAYEKFVVWIGEFNKLWLELSNAKGYPEISRLLETLFDEQPTRDVIREDAVQVGNIRGTGQLGILPGSGTLTSQPGAIHIPKNTFYGN
ncbi:nucleotidyltransferase domain-containing protein [Coleofasciculus sp. E2-BRE-01]|uniref:nucleotidyltransferase domain-containing protein n=1 Tax=Coleofasciculus TaxID=669368 RepID=UPI0032FD91D3